MTSVRIRIGPECPFVTIRPLRRYIDSGGVWLAQPVTYPLVTGALTTDLDPTTGAIGAWIVEEHGGITRCIEVPDSADILDYESLRDLDPSSFAALDQATGADVLAEWLAVVTGVKDAADTAAVNAQAAAGDALVSLGAAVIAEVNTQNAATTATTKAALAAAAQQAADTARDTALTAKDNAVSARSDALAAQVLAETAATTATAAALTATAPAQGMVDAAITAQDIGGQVSTATVAAVAAAPTVVAAAGEAVGAALAAGGVVTTQDVLADEAVFTIVDNAGRRSWVEVGADGKPTASSVGILGTVLTPAMTTVAALTGTTTLANPEAQGYLFAITDNADRVAIGIRPDGTFDVLKPGIGGVADGTITLAKLDPAIAARLLAATTGDIVCWGDSLTQGAGSTAGATYPYKVSQLTGKTVRNGGVGGEGSQSVSARQGGNVYLAIPAGNAIPASGPVNVTLMFNNSTAPQYPLLQGAGTDGGAFVGSLAGVPGTLTLVQPTTNPLYSHHADDYYVFTRTTPGAVVPVTRPQPIYSDFALARRGDINVYWYGRNDVVYGVTVPLQEIRADILFANTQRFLVLGVTPSTTDIAGTTTNIAAVNLGLFQAFGRRFIDVGKYLMTYGLEDAGITPTATDTTDIASGWVPSSLRSDGVHLNTAGYNIVGALVAARIKEMGWA